MKFYLAAASALALLATVTTAQEPPVFDETLKMWTMSFGANLNFGDNNAILDKARQFAEFIQNNPDGVTKAARDWAANCCPAGLVSNGLFGDSSTRFPLDATLAVAGEISEVTVFWLATEETMTQGACSLKSAQKIFPKPFEFKKYGQVGNFDSESCLVSNDDFLPDGSLNCEEAIQCEACTSPEYSEWKGTGGSSSSAITASVSAVAAACAAAVVALGFF